VLSWLQNLDLRSNGIDTNGVDALGPQPCGSFVAEEVGLEWQWRRCCRRCRARPAGTARSATEVQKCELIYES
jgi:hypothetical protein